MAHQSLQILIQRRVHLELTQLLPGPIVFRKLLWYHYPRWCFKGVDQKYAANLANIRAALPPQVVAEAEARGRHRDLQKTAAEILAELEEVVMV